MALETQKMPKNDKNQTNVYSLNIPIKISMLSANRRPINGRLCIGRGDIFEWC